MRANRANPDDPLPLLAFYQSYTLTGAKPPKNAVDGLEAVVATMPQHTQFRQLLVEEDVAQRRWRAAIVALAGLLAALIALDDDRGRPLIVPREVGRVVNPVIDESILRGLVFGWAPIPAFMCLAGAAIFFTYAISRERHAEIVTALAAKRAVEVSAGRRS